MQIRIFSSLSLPDLDHPHSGVPVNILGNVVAEMWIGFTITRCKIDFLAQFLLKFHNFCFDLFWWMGGSVILDLLAVSPQMSRSLGRRLVIFFAGWANPTLLFIVIIEMIVRHFRRGVSHITSTGFERDLNSRAGPSENVSTALLNRAREFANPSGLFWFSDIFPLVWSHSHFILCYCFNFPVFRS